MKRDDGVGLPPGFVRLLRLPRHLVQVASIELLQPIAESGPFLELEEVTSGNLANAQWPWQHPPSKIQWG